MSVYENNIVPIKISHLAEYVSQRKRISLDEALVYIYSNPKCWSLTGTSGTTSARLCAHASGAAECSTR